MADYNNMRTTTITRGDASIDQGLRSYMLGVYNLMMFGLAITGILALSVAYFAATNYQFKLFLQQYSFILVIIPFGVAMFLQFGINRLSTFTAQALFIAYAALLGASLAPIFLVYEIGSIARTFFITATSFGGLSLYGYTTKRDLSPLRTFLVIGLIGLIIASLVTFFVESSALDFVISVAGVLIFAGLTAYDTQMIKEAYYEGDHDETRGRKIVIGALHLYLDFVNLFLFLLRFLGNRD
ncbi:Bax inhibitor-1/YccA family protein [Bartonella sp. HY329]|uniref:Bax inhibitor-1/YccA family protein n=1 Tax=unclassified Bartonella TaxID=2645622 RepID=UPI0021C9BA67|nr:MULTISPECIES: Bax inhibitor-1/YccA family protein [unclassified Bartonella]UXM95779.1 Bax inhibitor-1/YccA family protein [Bartonella sp. HY329]UXN10104.1 Bax inhibitor-1/YccA family protein [Bartonella sp. HY328]